MFFQYLCRLIKYSCVESLKKKLCSSSSGFGTRPEFLQTASCIWYVFVSNCKMYLFQIAECICLKSNVWQLEWLWDKARVSPRCSFQTCSGVARGGESVTWNIAGADSDPSAPPAAEGPSKVEKEKSCDTNGCLRSITHLTKRRRTMILDRDNRDNMHLWIDNDLEGLKRPVQIAWARIWESQVRCPYKFWNRDAWLFTENQYIWPNIFIYSHALHISEYLNMSVHGTEWGECLIWIYVWRHLTVPRCITGCKFWNLNTQNTKHTETFKHRIHTSDS